MLRFDERGDAEFLRKAPQLTHCRGALVQIDEVDFDTPLGKEAERGTRSGALSDAEDLDFHVSLMG